MKVDWNPSERAIALMKKIYDLKKSGMTYYQIEQIVKRHHTTVVAFNKYYEANYTKTS